MVSRQYTVNMFKLVQLITLHQTLRIFYNFSEVKSNCNIFLSTILKICLSVTAGMLFVAFLVKC